MNMRRQTKSNLGRAMVAILGLSFSGLVAAQPMDDEAQWKYSITPYFWGTNIDGTVGQPEIDVSADVKDALDFVDSAGALRFEMLKRWGIFGDAWFANLSNDKDTPLGKAEVSFDQNIYEAGGLYAFTSDVTGYFGIRYQDVSGDVTIPLLGKRDRSHNWTDGIIGVRYMPTFGKWLGILRADVGAGDSDLDWLAQAGIGYQFSKGWSGRLAYRYLRTKVEDENFKWDVSQDGVGLGLTYQW